MENDEKTADFIKGKEQQNIIEHLTDDEIAALCDKQQESAIKEIDFFSSEPEKKKDYAFVRNGKEYRKTDITGVYQVGTSGYAYRIYSKEKKINTYVTKNERGNAFETKKEAADALTIKKFKLGIDTTFQFRAVTFGQEWEKIRDTAERTLSKDAATLLKYDSIYKYHVQPRFGDRPLQLIEAKEFTDFLAEMYHIGDGNGNHLTGYSYAFVQSIYKYIYYVYSQAFGDGIIDAAKYLHFKEILAMPNADKMQDNVRFRVLTQAQILKIKELLQDTDLYIPFLIAISCGCRPGETFALCWNDIDFKNKTLRINKQITTIDKEQILKEPKSGKSGKGKRNSLKPLPGYRTIDMPEELCTALQSRKRFLDDAKAKNSTLFEQNRGLVTFGFNHKKEVKPMPDFVCRDSAGRYVSYSSFQYYAKIIREKYCIHEDGLEDFSFYTFRKTFLSCMAANNCPVGELMRIAGHSRPERLYESYYASTEMAEAKRKEAMKLMSEFIFKE